MTVLSNSLTPVAETITDPSDAPCGAASSAEPSYRAVTDVEGRLTVEFPSADFPTCWHEVLKAQTPCGITVTKWRLIDASLSLAARVWTLVFEVAEFDASQFAEPDYSDD